MQISIIQKQKHGNQLVVIPKEAAHTNFRPSVRARFLVLVILTFLTDQTKQESGKGIYNRSDKSQCFTDLGIYKPSSNRKLQ